MAFDIYTLKADAESIRDTVVQNNNTADLVGKWCQECTRFINGPASLMNIANTVRGETQTFQNTATRLGTWCLSALEFVGYKSSREELYKDLLFRGRQIRDEYRDNLNERRLGAWFYDFLTYTDYPGDTALSVFWIFTYTVGANSTVNMPLFIDYAAAASFQIDWGDGGEVETISKAASTVMPDTGFPHTYTAAGTYQIYVLGNEDSVNVNSLSFAAAGTETKNALVRLDQMGTSLPGLIRINFAECRNLREIGYQESYTNTLPNCYGFSSLFITTGLTSVPADFFTGVGNTNPCDFSYAFTNTLISTLPANLFDPIQSVSSISSMFSGCSLTSCTRLFRNHRGGLVTDGLTSVFRDSSYLNDLSADLLYSFPEALRVTNIFTNCRALTTIPSTLFLKQTVCNGFSYAFSQSGITAIPSELMASNIEANNLTSMFAGCTALTAIPDNFLQYNKKITSIQSMFTGCNNLTYIGSFALANLPELTNASYLFQGCSSLVNIPSLIFNGNQKLQTVSNAFYGTAITTTQSYWLIDSPQITDISYMCSSCSKLVSIQANTFRMNTEITNAQAVFTSCSSLTSVPSGLFVNQTKMQNMSFAFSNCPLLTSIPDMVTRYLTNVTDASSMIAYTGISAVGNLYKNMPNVTTLNGALTSLRAVANIPADVFAGMTKVTSINSMFASNGNSDVPMTIEAGVFSPFGANIRTATSLFSSSNMANITVDLKSLLSDIPNVTNVASMFINGIITPSFPDDIFANNPAITNTAGLFQRTQLSGSVAGNYTPPNVVANLTNLTTVSVMYDNAFIDANVGSASISSIVFPKSVTNFATCFYRTLTRRSANYAPIITGTTPTGPDGIELWNRAGQSGYPSTVSGTQCFGGQTGLTNYASIPNNWK